MANTGNRKVRRVKNIGTVYFDNNLNQFVGQIEIGKYNNGRKKYKRFYDNSSNGVVQKMRNYNDTHFSQINTTNIEPNISVNDFFMMYISTVKIAQVKHSSYIRNLCTFDHQIKPLIGEYFLTDLTVNIIQIEFINKLVALEYSYSTIHKAYVLLNEGLKYAHAKKLILENPCDLVHEPRKKTFSNTKEIRFFNDEEIYKFETEALKKNSNGKYRYINGLVLVILIYTGLRSGEIAALQWKDVHLEEGYLYIHRNAVVHYDKNKKRSFVINEGTKTNTGRIVNLTKSAKKYFTLLYDMRKPIETDYVLLVDSKNEIRQSPDGLRASYRWICNNANIKNPQSLHTLRHTCASLLIRKNVDVKIISEMLGHSSVSFTYNTYIHLIKEEKAKIIKELDI